MIFFLVKNHSFLKSFTICKCQSYIFFENKYRRDLFKLFISIINLVDDFGDHNGLEISKCPVPIKRTREMSLINFTNYFFKYSPCKLRFFKKKFRQIISCSILFKSSGLCDDDGVFWTKILYTLSNNINIDTRQVTNEVIFHPLKLFIQTNILEQNFLLLKSIVVNFYKLSLNGNSFH